MAGAGIGLCIICGRDNQPCVSDICQDCTMDEFWLSMGSKKLRWFEGSTKPAKSSSILVNDVGGDDDQANGNDRE